MQVALLIIMCSFDPTLADDQPRFLDSIRCEKHIEKLYTDLDMNSKCAAEGAEAFKYLDNSEKLFKFKAEAATKGHAAAPLGACLNVGSSYVGWDNMTREQQIKAAMYIASQGG